MPISEKGQIWFGLVSPWIFPRKYVIAKKKLWKRSAISFLISLTKKVLQPSKALQQWHLLFVQIFCNLVAVEQFPIHKVVIFFSLIFIIMGMRLKFFSKSHLKHWNTPMQVPHRSELQIMKIMKTLDGRGNFLVRDIKKPIALLFHSFLKSIIYFLTINHGETIPHQNCHFSKISRFYLLTLEACGTNLVRNCLHFFPVTFWAQ